MTEQPSALTIARFLQDNPDFFVEHAELFSALTVPHPNQARAISLGERQILALRDRLKEFERRLVTLGHQARFNESVAIKLNQWCAQMLAEPDARKLPGHIIAGLAQQFELPDVALRVWNLDLPAEGVAEPVSEDVVKFATNLVNPYCGLDKEFPVTPWLQHRPASMAIIALRTQPEAHPVGLLVLGSDDPQRYSEDMATDFLQTIGHLAASALSRLSPQPV